MNTKRDVLPVTRQSCRESAEVLGRAFVDEPVSLAVYKGFSPEKRLRNLTADFAAEMGVCIRYGYPLQICDDGKVVAAAVIYPPGSLPLPWIEQARLFIKSILGHDYYDIQPWLRWLAEIDKIHPQESHYYLEYLGVAPEYQGQGFGSTIMQYITARADKENTGCYLETASPANVPLYQRHGFKVITEKQIIGLKSWFMWRPAREVAHDLPVASLASNGVEIG
jgi:ribosomal protein S18 acetylase RimI-like enzyme